MKKAFILFVFGASLLFSFCVSHRREAFEQAVLQSEGQVKAGEFRRALDSYAAAYRKYPGEKTVLASYVRTLEHLKSLADKSFQAKDFAAAEKTYALLVQDYPRFKGFQSLLSFTQNSLSAKLKDCRFSMGEKQAREALEAGDFQRALDFFGSRFRDYPDEPVLAADFRKVLTDIKKTGDDALARKDFVSAGQAYAVLWTQYPSYEKLQKSLPFAKNRLEQGIRQCRRELTKRGLEQYRKGNLAEAVAVWQGILIFDPDNAEIKKAIETASEQLQKLQKK